MNTPGRLGKLLTAAAVMAAAATGYWLFGDQLSLASLAQSEGRLRTAVAAHPALAMLTAFAIYELSVAVSFPGATVLTPLLGWLFGFWKGLLLASFAATAGATLAFLLSRFLLRDIVQRRFGSRLEAAQAALDREGAFYLLTLRLVPVFPFFVTNLVMGLTQMPVRTFWWVSQLGMLPGACVFVYAGTTVPTLQDLATSTRSLWNWQLFAALTALGLLPLGLRYLLKLWRGEKNYGSN